MPACLVTGAAGFIGSHLVDRLLAEGWQVTGVDNFDPLDPLEVKQSNIAAHQRHSGYRLVCADVRDPVALDRLLGESYDVIVHLAALTGVRRSLKDPGLYQAVNVTGTQNVLEFAKARGIHHFVFASSSSVYGSNPNLPWREDDSVLRPISPYASTKVSGELLGHVYSHLYGIRFIGLRFFTVYGPRQRPDLAIHKFARLLLEGQPIPVFGDGGSGRDYTYVADIVAGIRAAMALDQVPFDILNLGNRRSITLMEMIRGLERALGVTAQLQFLPDQPGDIPHTCASIDKAAQVLGYDPRTDFHEGLGYFAHWLQQQADNLSLAPAHLPRHH